MGRAGGTGTRATAVLGRIEGGAGAACGTGDGGASGSQGSNPGHACAGGASREGAAPASPGGHPSAALLRPLCTRPPLNTASLLPIRRRQLLVIGGLVLDDQLRMRPGDHRVELLAGCD